MAPSPNIPARRLKNGALTTWEVAGIRLLSNAVAAQALRFAADGGVTCLVGRTSLVRAEILKAQEFQDAITNEKWVGVALNSGDDAFITRWLLENDWKFSIQNAPEAAVVTAIMDDSKLVKQLLRWRRNEVKGAYHTLFGKVGTRKLCR